MVPVYISGVYLICSIRNVHKEESLSAKHRQMPLLQLPDKRWACFHSTDVKMLLTLDMPAQIITVKKSTIPRSHDGIG